MKVCFFQAYNRDYIRAEALLEGLRSHGVLVLECKVNRRAPWRYAAALAQLVAKVRHADVVLANFRSFEILWILRLLTRKPIVYDAHISFWQSACEERGWFDPGSLAGRALRAWDVFNCRIADHVLIDTDAHRDYFVRVLGVPPQKVTRVYLTCESSVLPPATCEDGGEKPGGAATALWTGTGIPLQGLDVVLAAFGLLQDRGVPVTLRVVGSSRLIRALRRRAESQALENVRFLGQLPRREALAESAAADIGLGGHYSALPKAAQVIAGKAYELIAMGKAVIVGDSAATRELFVDGRNALLCRMGSAESLALAVERLAADPALRRELGAQARALYCERLLPSITVEPLMGVFRDLLEKRDASARRVA